MGIVRPHLLKTPIWKIDTVFAAYAYFKAIGRRIADFSIRFDDRRDEDAEALAANEIELIDYNKRYHELGCDSATQVVLDLELPKRLKQYERFKAEGREPDVLRMYEVPFPQVRELPGMSQLLEMLGENNTNARGKGGYLKKLTLREVRKNGSPHSVPAYLDFAWLIRMVDDFAWDSDVDTFEDHMRKYCDRFLTVAETYFRLHARPQGPALNPAAFVRFVEDMREADPDCDFTASLKKLEPWMNGDFMNRPEAPLTVPGYILAQFELLWEHYAEKVAQKQISKQMAVELIYGDLQAKFGFWWKVFIDARQVDENAWQSSKKTRGEIVRGEGNHKFFGLPGGRRGLYVEPETDKATKHLWNGWDESSGLPPPSVIVSRVKVSDDYWQTAVLSRRDDNVDLNGVFIDLARREADLEHDANCWHFETRPGNHSVMNGSSSIRHVPMTVIPVEEILWIVKESVGFADAPAAPPPDPQATPH